MTSLISRSKGNDGAERQPFNLQSCIEEALDLGAKDASEKGLRLGYTIEDDTPTIILGDPARLRQILVNLLSNAVKFTENGYVSILVSGRKLEGSSYEIHFAVKDTGIGIPEDKANRLFRPFSQVDASTARKYGGTGLGLVISKKLVEMMNGRIWVESEVGIGSTFHFTIEVELTLSAPIDTNKGISCHVADRHRNLDQSLRILLAEDNIVNQRVTLRMLSKLRGSGRMLQPMASKSCRPWSVRFTMLF
jgi:signal transduction histidine kinase